MLFVILTLALEALSPAQASAPAQSASQPASSGTSVALASCPNPNASAKYVDGAPPNLPHGLTVAGSASVLVIIGSNGRVLRADMSRSSANAQIDQAVFDAAAHGKYSPKLVNCAPVKGKYLFQVDFKPDPQR